MGRKQGEAGRHIDKAIAATCGKNVSLSNVWLDETANSSLFLFQLPQGYGGLAPPSTVDEERSCLNLVCILIIKQYAWPVVEVIAPERLYAE